MIGGSEGWPMPQLIQSPTQIEAPGNKPKIIREFFGQMNTKTANVSIAHMLSPSGWGEPGQTPEFDEYALVLNGALRIESKDGSYIDVTAGQAVLCSKGEWVRYSTPGEEDTEYVAVCLPAFAMDLVNRDPE